MEQLLSIETIVKLAAGLALLTAPVTLCRVFGLPSPSDGFWIRISGALLAGIAAATYAEGTLGATKGMGPLGLMLVNLAGAFTIVTFLVLRSSLIPRRGRFTLWTVSAVLAGLALIEIAYL